MSSRNESVKQIVNSITLTDLQRQFEHPIADAAKYFGICESIMKRVCRRHGIRKWPQRTIRSLKRQIALLESNLEAQDAEGQAPLLLQIDSHKLRLAQLYKPTPRVKQVAPRQAPTRVYFPESPKQQLVPKPSPFSPSP